MTTRNILFVHQSAEMYGSDKVLLYLVTGLLPFGFHPIVLLPEEGPLLTALRNVGIETHIVPVTKIERKTLTMRGLLGLPFSLLTSVRRINRLMQDRSVHIVYSNTLAVLGSAIWAKLRGIPHVWHVHEILMSPRVVRKGFPFLLRLLADKIICNSKMTNEWVVSEQPSVSEKSLVIWNGQGQRPAASLLSAKQFRESFGIAETDLMIALVGRINRWKGQPLLIDAANLLWKRGVRNAHFVIVGGVAAGQDQLLLDLNTKIKESDARGQIHLSPFVDDVWNIWDACDIAVVPSTEPEPFGMVAIEAMASSKPVLVAAHGGLLDIVEDEVSGLQFTPNNAEKLADQLQRLLASDNLRKELGRTGKLRQEEVFSLDAQVKATATLLSEMVGTYA